MIWYDEIHVLTAYERGHERYGELYNKLAR